MRTFPGKVLEWVAVSTQGSSCPREQVLLLYPAFGRQIPLHHCATWETHQYHGIQVNPSKLRTPVQLILQAAQGVLWDYSLTFETELESFTTDIFVSGRSSYLPTAQ